MSAETICGKDFSKKREGRIEKESEGNKWKWRERRREVNIRNEMGWEVKWKFDSGRGR